MVVYKFGGASVADAENIKNVVEIIANYSGDQLAVVISAMGKTTNKLEELLERVRNGQSYKAIYDAIINSNTNVISELFNGERAIPELTKIYELLKQNLERYKNESYDLCYDQIVSCGELMSTTIIADYLNYSGISCEFVDARTIVKTDDTYREGRVEWMVTQENVRRGIDSTKLIITQGFIGGGPEGHTTTLGREGSDYTAAILSYCLDAEYMAIWKDVPGVLTADPRLFENVDKIDRLSYREAIEMTYYGAKVIHPKTIKPLQNKEIPLFVKSFVNPSGEGTLISNEIELTYPPMIVVEPQQALIHISSKDFSFVGEDHLSKLFTKFNLHRVKINMMRNTAISFSVCTNDISARINNLIEDVQEEFNVVVDHNLELITVRHHTEEIVKHLKKGKIVLFEERLRQTIQMVVKDIPDMKRKTT